MCMHMCFELRQDALLVSQDNRGFTRYGQCMNFEFWVNDL